MLKMMVYNSISYCFYQNKIGSNNKRKGLPTLFKTRRVKKNNVAPPTTNNILQRVMTEPSFVDIVFSLGGSFFQFYICGINV